MVENNTIKLLTSIAQHPDEIDRVFAECGREQIKRFIVEREERNSDIRIESYQVLLRRALVCIEVSAYMRDDDM